MYTEDEPCRELQEENNMLRAVLYSLDDLLFVINLKGEITNYYQSPSKGELYTSPELFLHKQFKYVVPHDVADVMLTAMDRIQETGKSQRVSYSINTKIDTQFFQANISPLKRRGEDEIVGFVVLAREMTSLKAEIQAQAKRLSSKGCTG